MKRIFYFLLALTLGFTSCSDEDAGTQWLSDFEIDIEVRSVSTTSAVLGFTPSDTTRNYVVAYVNVSEWSDKLESMTGDEITETLFSLVSSTTSWQSYYLHEGSSSAGIINLNPNDTYAACAFAVNDAQTKVISSLSIKTFTTESGLTGEATDAWYGTWELESTSSYVAGESLKIHVVIKESYLADMQICGLDLSAKGWYTGVLANFEADGSWTVKGYNTHSASSSYPYATMAVNIDTTSLTLLTPDDYGDFTALTAPALENETDQVVIECAQVAKTDDGEIVKTVSTMIQTYYYNSEYWRYLADSGLGFNSYEMLVGPFTMTKIPSSLTVPSYCDTEVGVIPSADMELRLWPVK